MLIDVLRQWLRRASPAAADAAAGELLSAGRYEEALAAASRALALRGTDPLLHYQSGFARFMLGDAGGAAADLRRALELDPRSFDAHVLMGLVQQQARSPAAALASYTAAAALRPGNAEVHGYVGNVRFALGRHAEAVQSYERALALDPANAAVHSNLLLALNSVPSVSRQALFDAHRRWAAAHAPAPMPAPWRPADPDPERPLRIGYVSADFREHSVAYFIEPVWRRIDRSRYATFVYDNFAGEPDAVARGLHAHADSWRRVSGLSDGELVELVRSDRIDILVDLSGHTGGNRLTAFARRAAPVQATWFAYMNTTGVPAMDYRITDAHLAPPGDERWYTEKLARIPCCACFVPYGESPPVGALPAAARGFVTFGSFNNWTKVSPEVIAAWARILSSVPASRLVALVQGGDDPAVRSDIQGQFGGLGIAPERVAVEATRPVRDFLELVERVDIALDTFPYTGGTTSLHTLWMGVPVVTRVSEGETGRCTASYLQFLGLDDLAQPTTEGYCEAARRLAADATRLAGIRAALRDGMRASPMLQAAETTSAVEGAFREMWRAGVSVALP